MPATATVTTATAPGAQNPDVSRDQRTRLPTIPLDEAGVALRTAWASYLGLALVPPAAMIGSIFFLLFTGNDRTLHGAEYRDFAGMAWLVAGMIYIGVALPLAFYVRRLKWTAFYEGGVVAPKDYLAGWMAVWVPLVIGGVLGFVGLALSGEFANVFTSMLSFVVFLSMTPNGHALTRPVGDVDDPGTYEEPK